MDTQVRTRVHVQIPMLNNLKNRPNNFVAGKTLYSKAAWEQLTTDYIILQSIQGTKLVFTDLPCQQFVPEPLSFSGVEYDSLTAEINSLFRRQIIQKTGHCPEEFISNIFYHPKKDGSFRLILNLKYLNESIEYLHFKMDTLHTAVKLIRPNCYFASIDLKDAYYSVPVRPGDRKFLKFFWGEQLYQFTCLAQGLAPAPRLFTKIMKPVFAHLRKQGHTIVGYIDDSLIVADNKQECSLAVSDSICIMDELGLTVHPVKSVVAPTQTIEFLGFVLNSADMTVRVTQTKANGVHEQCSGTSRKRHISIRDLAKLVGSLVACEPGVQHAQLFYKRLEIAKNDALKAAHGNFEATLLVTQEMKTDLNWWIDNIHTVSKPVTICQPDIVLYSDASNDGWGGVWGKHKTGGQWSQIEAEEHINYLELTAAFFTLRSFCKDMNDVHIRLRIDNTTAVACINKKCSNVRILNELTRELWLWCKERNIFISALHLPGTLNTEADHESRVFNIDTEWMLFPTLFKKLTDELGTVNIDLFASRINNQVQKYVSWKPDPDAFAIDAFYVHWGEYNGYAFPPFSLIGAVLKKVYEDQATVLLVAPIWLTQPWFTKLLELLAADPVILPRTCLFLPQDQDKQHPIAKLRLIGCLVSGEAWKTRAYRSLLSPLSYNHGGHPLPNNMGVISPSGCTFAIKGRLIVCNHL